MRPTPAAISSAAWRRSVSCAAGEQPGPRRIRACPDPARAPGLTGKLPEPVATAAIEFLTTLLIHQPYQVGKPLRDDLAGVWSARRGTYRVLYRIRDDLHEVIILRA